MGAAAGRCASAGWRKEGELEGLFGWCRRVRGCAWGAGWRGEQLLAASGQWQHWRGGGGGGGPEASAADDLLEFSVGRLPWTCHAIWRLFICLLDELGLLRTSSSAGKLPRTIGRVA